MNTKSAFTLVETAIVLVVIGIIIAVTMKTLALVDAAKLRREISALDIMRAGIIQYYAANKIVPRNGGEVDVAKLVEQGTMPEAILTSNLSASTWTLIFCESAYENDNESFYVDNATGKYVCARMANEATNGNFVCAVDGEEDRDLKRGYARVYNNTPVMNDAEYDNCLINQNTYDFMYRLY